MSMLNRFRKQGGFQQLLTLIETCDPAKQKNLLHLVGVEDPGWAHLVKIKCLTLDRIFSWPDSIIHEIMPLLPEKVMVVLHSSLDPMQREKFRSSLPHMQLRNLDDQFSSSSATPSELNAARIKLFQIVRDLESEGKIKFQTFDPILMIDPSIAA